MIIAGVDIGTNTALMVVAEKHSDGSFSILKDEHSVPRLGEGIDVHGFINDNACARGVLSLQQFGAILHELRVESVRAVATSAMREATNGRDVLALLQSALGWPIEIISGADEARLTFLGSVGSAQEPTLMIDIGGGSTEYALGVNGNVSIAVSAPIGAVRFTERFATEKPIPDKQIIAARDLIGDQIALYRKDFRNSTICVGVAGTPIALAMIDKGLNTYDALALEGHVLSVDRVHELSAWLCSLTIDELRSIPGIHERRADIVPMGSVILAESMRIFMCPTLRITTRGLRFGAMFTAENTEQSLRIID